MPPTPGNGDSTRARVIDAAVACILEMGFYRASSNEIARRAGVTWGVIQYHFGTREGLLVAVHEHAVAELEATLVGARVTGETLDDRVRSFADALWGYYGRPEFLAYVQIMLNLSHDPTTEQPTAAALAKMQVRLEEHLPRLLDQVVGDAGEELGRLVFAALRGLAVAQQITHASAPMTRTSVLERERDMLIEAIVTYAEARQRR